MASPVSYSRAQVLLHWLIAAMVVFQIVAHGGIEDMWRDRMTGAIPNEAVPTPHTIVGFLILVLMIGRVVLRLRNGAPKLPETEPLVVRLVVGGTHLLFYVLLIGMPISGAVAWFGGLELPAQAHGLAGKALIALVILHVLGALTHQVFFKTEVMSRMSPMGGSRKA